MYYKFGGINQALVLLSQDLLRYGISRTPKNQSRECVEFPHPVVFEMNPHARLVTLPERKWNMFLPFLESLWIGLGWNDLDALPGRYVKSLYDFSDNGRSWRAAYGTRIRHAGSSAGVLGPGTLEPGFTLGIDQFRFVIDTLTKDPLSRQAVINIADSVWDQYDINDPKPYQLIKTKDQPCTRSLHFMTDAAGRLCLYVHMRSNDLIWGFSAVNFFNFTLMLSYMAAVLNMEVGTYYHIADSFHYYEDQKPKLEALAAVDPLEAMEADQLQWGVPKFSLGAFKHLDEMFVALRNVEDLSYNGFDFGDVLSLAHSFPEGSFQRDWAWVFLTLNNKHMKGFDFNLAEGMTSLSLHTLLAEKLK